MPKSPRSMAGRGKPFPVLLLVPFFSALVLFWLIPLAKGFWISLQSDSMFEDSHFVGWENYLGLLSDKRFFHALSNTFVYAGYSIAAVTGLSLLLAHLLQRAHARARGPIAFCLMLPGLTPPAILAFLYLLVFNGPNGLLNKVFLHPFGLPLVDWLRDPAVIKVALVMQTVWRWTGFVTLILLSGMEGIPRTYYDAARVEGAGRLRILAHVTLPMLSHVLAFVAVFLFLDAFVLFEGAYVLLGGSGGTMDAGLLLVAYAYQMGFSLGRFGTAAAMGFAMVPALMSIVWLLLMRRRGRRA